MRETREQIADRLKKLPQWVQSAFDNLARERDTAVQRLDEMSDNQTPSPFFVDELDCTSCPPEYRKVYFQTHQMEINHAGVLVRIHLTTEKSQYGVPGIEISYSHPDLWHGRIPIALVPMSHCQFRLQAPDSYPPSRPHASTRDSK